MSPSSKFPTRQRSEHRGSRHLAPDAGRREQRPEPRAGTVTAIEPQRNDQERVSIFLDGEFAFGISLDLQLEFHLTTGMTLDEPTATRLLAADEIRRATTSALHLLAYRPRSEGEIIQRLRQHGYGPDAIDGALAKLRDWRYVDDASFADRWVENRLQHRPRAPRLLARELRQKGVDRDTIQETLDNAEIDEVTDARKLAEQKMSSYQSLAPDVRQRRLSGFLARRGYGYDVIRAVLDELDAPEDEGLVSDAG